MMLVGQMLVGLQEGQKVAEEYDSFARICICNSSTRVKYSSASSFITICDTKVCVRKQYAFYCMAVPWCVDSYRLHYLGGENVDRAVPETLSL